MSTIKTYHVTFRNRQGQHVDCFIDATDVYGAVDGVADRPDCTVVVKAVPANG